MQFLSEADINHQAINVFLPGRDMKNQEWSNYKKMALRRITRVLQNCNHCARWLQFPIPSPYPHAPTAITHRPWMFYVCKLLTGWVHCTGTAFFLPPANEVWDKVMFLHLSVIVFTRQGWIPACNRAAPPPETPPGRHHPRQTTP